MFLIGGIYARPVALGNFLHFGVGCLVPTCARLLQVVPEDVSPRDDQDDDQRKNRNRFKILSELRRVYARPPLRYP
jgi:ribosomal protein L16 Arg81 hydroxylase